MLPSWIRSKKSRPRPEYRLAIDTTRRILASAILSFGRLSFVAFASSLCRSPIASPSSVSCSRIASSSSRFATIFCASSNSSSELSSGILPISRKYKRTESSDTSSKYLASLKSIAASASSSSSSSVSGSSKNWSSCGLIVVSSSLTFSP